MDRLDDFRRELRDRYGPIPPPVEWLLRFAELRILASHWQIAEIHLEGKWSFPPLPVGEGPGVRAEDSPRRRGQNTSERYEVKDASALTPGPTPRGRGETDALTPAPLPGGEGRKRPSPYAPLSGAEGRKCRKHSPQSVPLTWCSNIANRAR